MKVVQLFWRGIAGVLRRSGTVAGKLSNRAYSHSLPRLSKEDRKLIEANAVFRNRHVGQRCFIVGNGPSLATQDLSYLKGEITFAMNAFWKHPIIEAWQPTYYLLADKVLFDRSPSAREFFENLNRRITEADFFVPLSRRDVILEEQLLPREQTYFLSTEDRAVDEGSDESFDLTGSIPDVLTVAQFAMMAAIYMGCSPIYLMGLDHDWLAHRGEKNFYFFKGLSLNNHPEVRGQLGSYDEDMEGLIRVWKDYRKLKTLADSRNIQIINATAGGFLDVFDRMPYQSLFESAETEAHV